MSNETRAAEAAGKTGVVDFRGHTFEIPLEYGEWSADLLESIEEGKAVGIIRGALGAEQWLIVKSMDLKVRELTELGDKISAVMGFGSTGE